METIKTPAIPNVKETMEASAIPNVRKPFPTPCAGVYIHVPFCVCKCAYCDFYSLPASDDSAKDAYTNACVCQLLSELQRGIFADTVYFGGGTPSLLGYTRLERILNAVRTVFSIPETAEITLEANPLDLPAPENYRKIGFNRLSLGVQSADDAELALLGRRHSFSEACRTYDEARTAGFSNISLDLMYGLPRQTLARWLANVDALCALAPEHLSFYALRLEKTVPLYRRAAEQPDDDRQAEMYLAALSRMEAAGYRLYEISNAAKPDFESRHNSKYWLGADYYGFGPGAHSFIGGIRSAVPSDLRGYLENPHREIVEEAPDLREEYLMLRLRMTKGIDSDDYEARFGVSFAPVAAVLSRYIAAGLVVRDAARWRLTPQGMLVSNAILCEIL